jgi:Rps23 Pro-64 3,4-dihydroxylase Tpa1-like proline 4-hydroxylase
MSSVRAVATSSPCFPYYRWHLRLPALAARYRANTPIPHIFLQEFLDPALARTVADEFPHSHTDLWTRYKHANENKLGMAKRELFPPGLRALVDELNSATFLQWLSALTGIPDLISDPELEGGGLHQAGRGGFLNIHTDFSHHHYQKHWQRRVNLIVYLNSDWRMEWGGAIELWDANMKACVAKYPPLLNHALIFSTEGHSLHGFPEPLGCPAGISRKSLALYYYTIDGHAKTRSTDYRARPSDGLRKSMVMWLDKQIVNIYSRAKTRFGFSDRLASRILGLLSREE